MVISTCSRGTTRVMLLSPACGPAPVTSVPATRTAANVTPINAVSRLSGAGGGGTLGRSETTSGSPTFTYSRVASHTMPIETSK
ncbi:Uncharacterised protein [Mycobacteroides abscessus subsp. abscessus]|nr:Uncharacterised protein [Mycobacteroides abscessus subsp. abscessus]